MTHSYSPEPAPKPQQTIKTDPLDTQSIFRVFLKLGCTSFGGPIAHIAYFHKEFVGKRRWLNDHDFSQLLALCQFLPGPASSQLGFGIGLLQGGWRGAIAAFVGFTLPSVLLLMLFAASLSWFSSDTGQILIHGLKLVACAVVADALISMYSKLCPDNTRQFLALAAAVILIATGSVFTQFLIIIAAGFIGYGLIQTKPEVSQLEPFYGVKQGKRLLFLFAALLVLLPVIASSSSTMLQMANAFYQAGATVFGGGHVVLPLLSEHIVNNHQWLNEAEFLTGYGAAQAIPGPMFAFSAYIGALVPTGAGSVLSATVACLFMFLPGFLLLAGVLPYWGKVSQRPQLFSAIAGINAAVVGILGAALYDPIFTSGITSHIDMAIALMALGMLRLWKVSPLLIVMLCVSGSLLFN